MHSVETLLLYDFNDAVNKIQTFLLGITSPSRKSVILSLEFLILNSYIKKSKNFSLQKDYGPIKNQTMSNIVAPALNWSRWLNNLLPLLLLNVESDEVNSAVRLMFCLTYSNSSGSQRSESNLVLEYYWAL